MATKIDVQTLIKHRFWIILGTACLLWLISIFSISGLKSMAEQDWNTAKSTDDQLKAIHGGLLYNDQWIARIREETEKAKKQKDEIWWDAWERQNEVVRAARTLPRPATSEPAGSNASDQIGRPPAVRWNPLITWPQITQLPPLPLTFSPQTGFRGPGDVLDFGEPYTSAAGVVPNEYKEPNVYLRQYEEMIVLVRPLDEKTGTGAVRFYGSGAPRDNARQILRPIVWGDKQATWEEFWLAQEEVAIKRELLKIVAAANDDVGQMRDEWEEKIPPPLPASTVSEDTKTPAEGESESTSQGASAAEAKESVAKPRTVFLDHKRYLNTTWQVGVVPYDQEKGTGPSLNWWDGWLLDMDLVRVGPKQVELRITESNLSHVHRIPPTPLVVIVEHEASGQRWTVDLKQAGDLPPSRTTVDPKTKQQTEQQSNRVWKPIVVPEQANKIVAVQRKPQAPELDRRRFQNGLWLVDARLLEGPGGQGIVEGTFYNISGRRLLPSGFEAVVQDARKVQFSAQIRFEGKELRGLVAGESRPLPRSTVQVGTPRELIAMRMTLDWRTVPIKRIDRIEMGRVAHSQSDRTYLAQLVEYDFARKGGQAASPAVPATAPGPGGSTGVSGMPEGGAGMGAAGAAAGAGLAGGYSRSQEKFTPIHRLPTERYVANDEGKLDIEVRRIPIAMVVIVDQRYINNVLTAVNNSRLRIQITQVVFTRVPELPRPGTPQTGGTGTLSGPGAGAPGAPGGLVPPGAPPGTGAPRSPLGPSAPKEKPKLPKEAELFAGPLDEDTTPVELQIYGWATIYENPEARERIQKKTAGQVTQGAGP
ncbi:MAG: hypothetical protein C4297_01595 [Gemmataceae bacterium]